MTSDIHLKQNKKKGTLELYIGVGIAVATIAIVVLLIVGSTVIKVIMLSVTALWVLKGVVSLILFAFNGGINIC